MKRTISFALAALMIAASLASCAAPKTADALPANIRVTSSDAEPAAAWLAERLGDRLTDSVVLGTSGDAYGVDVSALEADGFFIRSFGREDVLFARTPDGLDRAVRKYAKADEAGTAIGDVTYHEGYRVKRIELAGRDISEYTIYCEDDSHMLGAANELSSLVAKACGATLAVSAAEPQAPYIIMKYVRDGSLNTCGYRWSVNGGGLTIECSDGYTPTSGHFAVIRFLENELGWLGLTFGYEALPEADLISIPEGRTGGETNAFQFLCPYGDQYSVGDRFDHSYGDHYGGFSTTHMCGIPQCCHGMQSHGFAGELSKTGSWGADQPCYLDDEFYELCVEDVSAYIDSQLSAGKVIGEDFFFIDVAAGDNGNWCHCKACRKMYKDEGYTEAGAVVTWANRLTETLDETYPGLAYGIFAYAGSNKPPKTVVPNDLIYITFCYDMSCDVHAHTGADCTGDHLLSTSSPDDHRTVTLSPYLERWCEISGNMYVWFYGMELSLHSASYVDMIVDDMRYFASLGVSGLFWEAEDAGFSTDKVSKWLMSELCWNADMTDEEADAYLDRVLCATYGEDAAPLVKEYIEATETVQKNSVCAHCWFNAVTETGVTPTLAPAMWAKQFDAFFDLIESARLLAQTRMQEWRLTKLSLCCIYCGCLGSYFDAYEAGDDERCAELSRRYALIGERLRAFGFDYASLWTFSELNKNYGFDRYDDLECLAWTVWASTAPQFMRMTHPTREMPERIAEIIAENAG